MTTALWLLLAVALLGALDTLWYHEWRGRLPGRQGAQRELRLHAGRDFAYGLLFLALGWGRPAGALVWVLLAVVLLEVVITLVDFVEEDRNRPLAAGERVLHTAIAIVYGSFLASLLPLAWAWAGLPAAYHVDPLGPWSWLFSALSLGVFGSGVRDLLAARRLDLRAAPAHEPGVDRS